MIRLNSILANSIAGVGTQSAPLPQIGGTPERSIPGGDRFIQGEWWRNHSQAQQASHPYGLPGKPLVRAASPVSGDVAQPEGGRVNDSSASGSNVEGRDDVGNKENAIPNSAAAPKKANGEPLSQDEQLELAQLRQIDAKVKAHEMAHIAAAGPYAKGGASFSYKQGPDGQKYAVAGEVPIDMGKAPSPEETIQKMQVVRAAALAPADPSPQDRKVAAKASMAITEATREMELERLARQKAAHDASTSAANAANSAEEQGRSNPYAQIYAAAMSPTESGQARLNFSV